LWRRQASLSAINRNDHWHAVVVTVCSLAEAQCLPH